MGAASSCPVFFIFFSSTGSHIWMNLNCYISLGSRLRSLRQTSLHTQLKRCLPPPVALRNHYRRISPFQRAATHPHSSICSRASCKHIRMVGCPTRNPSTGFVDRHFPHVPDEGLMRFAIFPVGQSDPTVSLLDGINRDFPRGPFDLLLREEAGDEMYCFS